MSVVRIKKKENTFAQIDKGLLQDTRLSYAAIGLVSYLLSKPDWWEVRISDLIKPAIDGKKRPVNGIDSVRSILQELKKEGYAKLITLRDEKTGYVTGKNWEISEVKYSDVDNQQLIPTSGKTRHRESTDVGKTPITNNKVIELSKDSSKCAEYSFDDFWNAYGLKRDKTKCAAKFAKLSKKEKAAIERTLPMYISETTLEDVKGKKFVPRRKNPLTYLNQKTWNDYLERIEEARKDETVLSPEMQEQYDNYLKWVEEKHPDLLSTVRYLSKEQFKIYKTVSKRQGPSTRKWALGKAHRELSDGEASAANVFERYDAILDERLKAQAV